MEKNNGEKGLGVPEAIGAMVEAEGLPCPEPWNLHPHPQTLMEAFEESPLGFGPGTSTVYIENPIPLLPIEKNGIYRVSPNRFLHMLSLYQLNAHGST